MRRIRKAVKKHRAVIELTIKVITKAEVEDEVSAEAILVEEE